MLCCRKSHYMCHTCAKEFLDSNFNQAVIDKISNCPKFHIFTKIIIFKVYANCFIPMNFQGRDMSGILFFIFASCELLQVLPNRKEKEKKVTIKHILCMYAPPFFSHFFIHFFSKFIYFTPLLTYIF